MTGKRFGSKRVSDCVCTTSFTCEPCLRAAAPFINPSRVTVSDDAFMVTGIDRAGGSQPANTRAPSFEVPAPPAGIDPDDMVLAWVSRLCRTCGDRRDYWSHQPASDCADCKAPLDHHEFELETPEQAQRRVYP